MDTTKIVESLQRWLRAGIERSPDTREVGAGTEGCLEGTVGDHHETNHPKDPAGGRPE
jgi:hypothetical protein